MLPAKGREKWARGTAARPHLLSVSIGKVLRIIGVALEGWLSVTATCNVRQSGKKLQLPQKNSLTLGGCGFIFKETEVFCRRKGRYSPPFSPHFPAIGSLTS